MKKVFAILNINYNFNPISATKDFDASQIKALKECSSFIKKPYIISCLFHFSQCVLSKFKEYHIINQKLISMLNKSSEKDIISKIKI